MRDRFHTAMYRVLLAGAVLTRQYMEPLVLAVTDGPPGLLQRMNSPEWIRRCDGNHGPGGPCQDRRTSPEDLQYLERFPAYHLEASLDTWEPAFGDLARWLLEDIDTTALRVDNPQSRSWMVPQWFDDLDPQGRGRLQEVVFFLAAHSHMVSKLWDPFLKVDSDDGIEPEDLVPPPIPGRVREASVAMFASFRPEEITMPAKVRDASRCYLVHYPLGNTWVRENPVLPQVSPWTTDISYVLRGLREASGRPNRRNGLPSPPPDLFFVEFVLRKFFGLGFRHDLFDDESPRYSENFIYGFLNRPDLFGDTSIRSTHILVKYTPPQLSYGVVYS